MCALQKGLFYLNVNSYVATMLVTTVKENKNKYTLKQCSFAKKSMHFTKNNR